jgi:hypothetical protein
MFDVPAVGVLAALMIVPSAAQAPGGKPHAPGE